MRCLGEVRSPLEAPVQELCNARLVEVFCTWTKASLQLLPANSIYVLLPSGPRLTSVRRLRTYRCPANWSRLSDKVILDRSNLGELTSPTERWSSITHYGNEE